MVDGTTLTVTFDEALDTASVPSGSSVFTVTVTRDGSTVSGYTVSALSLSSNGTVLTLTLSQAVRGGDTVTLAYVQPSSGTKLQDRATTPNPVADFTTGSGDVPAVDNRTPSVKGVPVFAGAAEAYAIGDRDRGRGGVHPGGVGDDDVLGPARGGGGSRREHAQGALRLRLGQRQAPLRIRGRGGRRG